MREVTGSCPLDCPDGCSWVVTVDDAGRAVSLRGNREHPFTRGGLCAKVNPLLGYASAPDRLLHPLRRVGAKGEGRFERITWNDALTEIAERLHQAIATHGPESIWPYAGTGTVSMIQGMGGSGKRLFHALGTSRHAANICAVAGHAGMAHTTGSAMGMDPEDLAHSGLVVLWGTNTLTTNLHLWPYVSEARATGAPLVVVDPVRTRTAAQADFHIAPRPGTDAALALGLMAELVRIGATDEEYLARWSLGWAEFRDSVLLDWDVRRAAEVCGLHPDEVSRLAGLIAGHRPTGIRTLMGMQRHQGGGQAARVLSCLPAVTGDYARRGGGLVYSTSPAYDFNTPALNRPDLHPQALPTPRTLQMSSLGRLLVELDDPPVSALVMWAANPVVSNPDQSRVRQGLAREDLFTVVVDHVASATTAYADIVLPGTTQLEHLDLTDSYSHVYVQLNRPAVAAPGEALPHTEIFRRLASAMGLAEPALQDSDEDLIRAALSGEAPHLQGITWESLNVRGWQRLAYPEPYLPFEAGFPTASGLFEFVSDRGERDGAGRLPTYTPPREPAASPTGPGRPSVVLLSTANHYLLNSTFATSALHTRRGEATIEVHPTDAVASGVAHGDLVDVGNARGSFTARAHVVDTVRPGVARTSKGLSPDGPAATSVNATTADADSDLGRGATFHDNRVWLRAVGAD